jgi:hypothetical protein
MHSIMQFADNRVGVGGDDSERALYSAISPSELPTSWPQQRCPEAVAAPAGRRSMW